jgi:hypothetical protein
MVADWHVVIWAGFGRMRVAVWEGEGEEESVGDGSNEAGPGPRVGD